MKAIVAATHTRTLFVSLDQAGVANHVRRHDCC